MNQDALGRFDIALSLVLLLGLALPFLPLPGRAPAQMHVRFQVGGMSAPRTFKASTTLTDCRLLANALAYDHRDSGAYVRITCEN